MSFFEFGEREKERGFLLRMLVCCGWMIGRYRKDRGRLVDGGRGY